MSPIGEVHCDSGKEQPHVIKQGKRKGVKDIQLRV